MGSSKSIRHALIDANELRKQLTALHAEHRGNDTKLRAATLAHLKTIITQAHKAAEALLVKNGKGTQCAANLAHFQDELIRVLYDFTVTHIYRATNPSSAERIAIVAVGGYGRGTLAPGSDLDLLFLLPYKQTAWSESVIEYMLYLLWDLGFKVGHATRSIDECIRLSQNDLTIRTAVLEARFLWGDQGLFDDLEKRFDEKVVAGTGAEFIEAKLTERDERHKRQGSTRYLVEPNVKDGKGGQRDLHTLYWIAKYFYRVQSGKELVSAGAFSRQEYRKFQKCEDFQWAVRCHLHFMTDSSDNRITFDHQKELAHRLGYTAHGGLQHVERFMKHYFLVAKDVGDLTRIFCAVLEAQQVKKAPVMNRLFRKFRRSGLAEITKSGDFSVDSGRMNVTNDAVFQNDPVNLLRLFYLADKHNFAIHPSALKLVTRSLRLIGHDLRSNAEANRLFLAILTSRNNPETTLRKMNEAGVLGRFLRDFGKIVAMMQFNMYHHFTVDEHLLQSIGILSEIERGELADQHPLSDEIIHEVSERRALYVAMLLHDIAKGRPEDHSIAGAQIARRVGKRLGLTPSETETAAWLVENHLVMSDFAQKRDLNDFKTIQDFAAIVRTPEQLKLLLILTVADIKAVGPGVWNGWKGQLLRTLYHEVEPLVSGGHVSSSREERAAAAKRIFAEHVKDRSAEEIAAYIERHIWAYWLTVDLENQLDHADLIRQSEQNRDRLTTRVGCDDFTEITEITVYTHDHPRLLSILAGSCAAVGANIADAQIFTTTDGFALDTIYIQREFADDHDEQRRAGNIIANVEKGLRGEIRLPELVKRAGKTPARLKAFSIEPQVAIHNERSNIFTVIEVNGLDRPGLLYDLTIAFFRLNVKVASAHIATFGERAVDSFYVTDLTGQKIVSQQRQKEIKRHMIEILQPPSAKAPSDSNPKTETEALA